MFEHIDAEEFVGPELLKAILDLFSQESRLVSQDCSERVQHNSINYSKHALEHFTKFL